MAKWLKLTGSISVYRDLIPKFSSLTVITLVGFLICMNELGTQNIFQTFYSIFYTKLQFVSNCIICKCISAAVITYFRVVFIELEKNILKKSNKIRQWVQVSVSTVLKNINLFFRQIFYGMIFVSKYNINDDEGDNKARFYCMCPISNFMCLIK